MSSDAKHKPLLLDAFCGAGGAAVGYSRAGFDVVGVDIRRQSHYPFRAYRSDALVFIEKYGHRFDAIHASPPCQAYSKLVALAPHKSYVDYVSEVRLLLTAVGKPFVIENVMTAPLDKRASLVLCGNMFGLRTYRHRRFEQHGFSAEIPMHPAHTVRSATRYRPARWLEGWHISVTGNIGTWFGPEAMGIDWMTSRELSEAIPPAYTEYVGRYLAEAL